MVVDHLAVVVEAAVVVAGSQIVAIKRWAGMVKTVMIETDE